MLLNLCTAVECPAGQYLQRPMGTPATCMNCSRGFFQPHQGQFSCIACPADKTTKYTGTVMENDCSSKFIQSTSASCMY